MGQVITLEDYLPVPRYDAIPWTQAEIEEGTASVGPWTLIDTIALDPVDVNPAKPQTRNLTTENGTDVELWYRVTFLDADSNPSQATAAVQNVPFQGAYATVEELAEILRVKVDQRLPALERVLAAARLEIDDELGLDEPFTTVPALAAEVNLERAVEHWQQMQSPFGIIGLGAEGGATYTARDSWDRHAHKLSPLKESWGFA